jgi:hypothetical protein
VAADGVPGVVAVLALRASQSCWSDWAVWGQPMRLPPVTGVVCGCTWASAKLTSVTISA